MTTSKKYILVILLLIATLCAGAYFWTVFGIFKKGLAAHQSGDLVTAINLWKPELKWIRSAAHLGHADSQSALGLMYYRGDGLPKDDKEAVK